MTWCGKTLIKSDSTFVDKRAQRIIKEVESIVVSQQPSTDETDSQGSNSEASITLLMRDEAFYKVDVRLFCGSIASVVNAYWQIFDKFLFCLWLW